MEGHIFQGEEEIKKESPLLDNTNRENDIPIKIGAYRKRKYLEAFKKTKWWGSHNGRDHHGAYPRFMGHNGDTELIPCIILYYLANWMILTKI